MSGYATYFILFVVAALIQWSHFLESPLLRLFYLTQWKAFIYNQHVFFYTQSRIIPIIKLMLS